MPSRMHSGKTLWVAAAAAILIIFLVILFASNSAPSGQDTIVLPTPPVDSNPEDIQGDVSTDREGGDFIEITNDNVATVLKTLSRPSSYHQSYTVAVGSVEKQHQKTVNLWINNGITHAEISFAQQVQSVITDGETLYLWYDNQRNFVKLDLDEGMTPEDVLGLPDFDAYLSIPQGTVTDAGYTLLEEEQISCIYVSSSYGEGGVIRYWVNLDNGLMYQADASDHDTPVYTVQQMGFDLLAIEDEGFSNKFTLPDGTKPFTAETETQQP